MKPQGPVGQHKVSKLYIIKVSKGQEKNDGAERVFKEIMTENSPNLTKYTNL